MSHGFIAIVTMEPGMFPLLVLYEGTKLESCGVFL